MSPMTSPLDVFRDNVLAGHVALVTGGGTGICRGIAAAYARFGADVCIVSRKPDVLEATAAELSAATGRDGARRRRGCPRSGRDRRAVAKTIERFGKLDTLVNGAAGNFLAPAAALSPNGFKTVIDIDLVGTFNASRAAFEALRTSGDGLVLNISATLHYHGTPLQIHASAAKAGVDAVTQEPRRRVGPFGIRACGIAPGPIGDTEGMRRLAPGELGAKAMAAIPRRPVRHDRRDRRGGGVSCARRQPRTSAATCSSSTAGTASRRRRSGAMRWPISSRPAARDRGRAGRAAAVTTIA